MVFISEINHPKSRTWDPERDITLKSERRMSDGTMFMQLTTQGSVLPFVMYTTFEPPVSGSDKPVIVRHVKRPTTPLATFTREETLDVIREALEAYKGIYGMHPDEVVRVIFEP